MKTLITIIIVACATAVFAQKPPVKFGDVTLDELKMKQYDKDTSAAALIIADFGDSELKFDQTRGFIILFERVRRVKIFKKDGYDLANFSVQLYHSNELEEKISGLKAVTYNLEGNKIVETKMKNDAVFKEKYDRNIDVVKITLPNVKEGSVIEITYKVASEFLFNFQDWEFQSTVPTKWSEYRARIPEYFQYEKYTQGYVTMAINETKTAPDVITITTKERSFATLSGRGGSTSGTTFDTENINLMRYDSRWAAQDVPAFKEEPNMNNTVDYISKINFELGLVRMPNSAPKNYMNSWESLNQEFLENEYFGKAVSGSGFLNDDTKDLLAGVTDENEKVAKIYGYVKDNVEWNGSYRKYVSEGLKNALQDKKGSSADINLMLTSMLQKAGFDANPVLISTRNHGFIRKSFPVSGQFNYVICAVTIGGKVGLLDATDRSLPMNVLPERCLNGEGYMISPNKSGWVSIAPNFKSKTVTDFSLALSEEGNLTGTISFTRDGYDAQRMRKSYFANGETEYLTKLTASRQWDLKKSTFDNTQKLGASVLEKHELAINDHVQTAGDVMYINPLLTDRITENPYKTEKRNYPVDLGSPFETVYLGKFTIPAGYTADELPKPKMLLLPNSGGKYVYNVTVVGENIQVLSQLAINQPLFTTEQYLSLREFYSQVVAKQAEQIVLKKK